MELAGWVFLVVVVIIIVLWAVYGRRNEHEFVGLAPLIPGEAGVRYLGGSEKSDDRPLASNEHLARVAAEALEEDPDSDQKEDPKPKSDEKGDEKNDEKNDEKSEASEESIDTFSAERRASGEQRRAREPTQSEETNEETVSLKTPRPYRGNGQYSRKEEICRLVLEEIYGLPFPKVRPDFLRNPETGRNLELDGYCHSVRVGFEFNGSQHYTYPNNYHKSSQEFMRQVRRDNYKYKLCKRLGIHLIVVPNDVPADQIRQVITDQLPQKGHGVIYVNPKKT